MRLFSRACARAALPVVFSEGFNPRVRLSLPFPRPVGQASDVERVVLQLHERLDAAQLQDRLQAQMPVGIQLRAVLTLPRGASCQPRWVRYAIAVPPERRTELADAARRLLHSPTVNITRVRHRDGRSKVVDIRPFVEELRVDDTGLHVKVNLSPAGTATPVEVCRALGMEDDALNHQVRRVEIEWHKSPQTSTSTTP
jgi:radical SAM-linked protein